MTNPLDNHCDLQVIGLLDHFWIEKAILVGNSAGGTVSMQTALAHPESITAQILVDPVVYSGGGTPDWMRPFLSTPQMRRVGPLIARQLQAAGEELIAMAWHDPSLLQTDVLEMDKEPVQVENWDKALWEFTLASRAPGLAGRLDQLTLPVLVICGSDDKITPPESSQSLARLIPAAQLKILARAGHMAMMEAAAKFNEAIKTFVLQTTESTVAYVPPVFLT